MGQATALQAGRCHLPENQSGTVPTRWTAGGAKLLTWDHLARPYVLGKAVCLEITCPFTIPTAIISRTVFDAALDFVRRRIATGNAIGDAGNATPDPGRQHTQARCRGRCKQVQLMDTRRVAPVLCGVVAFRSVQRRTKRSMALLKTGPNRGFHMFGAKAETDQARRKPP
jgi:hypothetical protein